MQIVYPAIYVYQYTDTLFIWYLYDHLNQVIIM